MNDAIVEKAGDIASRAHANQMRRDGLTPYITHPARVAEHSLVRHNPAAQAVAWLHDVLEDHPEYQAELMTAGFPDEVLEAVGAITRNANEPYSDYLARVLASPLASRVKAADIIDNLNDDPLPQQLKKYARALVVLTENFA